jgi:hypothetical protein
MQQLSKLYHLPETQQIWYAAFHLTGAAHRWFMRTTKDAPVTEWALFSKSLIHDFGPPIDWDTIGDLAPPRHVGTMNDYINNFIAYALHVGITSEFHQVSLFVTGLQDELQLAVT